MKRLAAVLTSVAAVAVSSGCEEAERLSKEDVVVFSLLQSPDFELPDGSTQKGVVAATAFYGKRPPGSPPDTQPEGVPGATVTLKWQSKQAQLTDKGEGAYALDSLTEIGALQDGVTYNIEVINDNVNPPETFTGQVTAPPAVVIREFESTDAVCHGVTVDGSTNQLPIDVKKCREHTKNTEFTITRQLKSTGEAATDPSKNDLGFWAVYKISRNVDPKNPNATNAPKEPVDFLRLLAADAPYRAGTFTIPGTAFADAGSEVFYGVGLAVARKGTTSPNLFLGSQVIAGHGSGGVLRVK